MNLFQKYYLIVKNKQPLLESIYSGKAIIYHRTRVKDLINLIYKEGYKLGDKGIVYGDGIYGTYDLKTQINPEFEMKKKYGPVIVKIIINSINNFLILDYNEFIKTNIFKKLKSTKKTFIIDQLKYFNFDLLKPLKNFQFKNSKYSSNVLKDILGYYGTYKITRVIDGVIFTSNDENKNVVCYNLDLIIPVSFSLDDGETWTKVDKNKDYLKKVFSQYTDDVKIKYKKDTQIKHWIEDAKISKDADFKINDLENYHVLYNNQVDWKSGTWYEGTWYNGFWNDGIWKKGTWKDGTWRNGTWEYGTWKNGEFLSGIWLDGAWEIGQWKGINKLKDVWKNGTWERGNWWNGTWENGMWKDGNFLGGEWLDGTWKGGNWYGGNWLGGYDKNGKYHPKGDSPDKWKI